MKTIAFLVHSLEVGGAETYLLRFIRHANNMAPIVICKSGHTGVLHAEMESVGAKIYPMKVGYFNVFDWYRLFVFFRKHKVDTVCDFTGNLAGIPLFAAWLAGIPKRLVFFRCSRNPFEGNKLKEMYDDITNWLVCRFATKILSNSQAGLDYYFNPKVFKKMPSQIIRNGTDTLRFKQEDTPKSVMKEELGIPENMKVVGHTARYDLDKNQAFIFEVAKSVIKRCPDAMFFLCGKGIPEAFESYISQNQELRGHIVLAGYRSDIHRVLRAFDVFFLPSATEGQPNSLIEAMVAGLPIVASDIDAIKETVPMFAQKQLVGTHDIQGAADKITEILQGASTVDWTALQSWAMTSFDPAARFSEFESNL